VWGRGQGKGREGDRGERCNFAPASTSVFLFLQFPLGTPEKKIKPRTGYWGRNGGSYVNCGNVANEKRRLVLKFIRTAMTPSKSDGQNPKIFILKRHNLKVHLVNISISKPSTLCTGKNNAKLAQAVEAMALIPVMTS
jgi:hypothetical protein